MRTFVYVDGFNFHYGALKGTPWKWLDPVTLFRRILQPQHEILSIKYFTARVAGTSVDPSKPQRQDIYLRAVQRFRPEVAVYFGHFLSHTTRMPLARPEGKRHMAEVSKPRKRARMSISRYIF